MAEGADDEPPKIALNTHGGGGGPGSYETTFWLWPVPPPGAVTLAAEWPALGIELTRHEIDAGLIIDAAARSEVLWPEDAGGASEAMGG